MNRPAQNSEPRERSLPKPMASPPGHVAFISYKQSDCADFAARLHDRLELEIRRHRAGRGDYVFLDNENRRDLESVAAPKTSSSSSRPTPSGAAGAARRYSGPSRASTCASSSTRPSAGRRGSRATVASRDGCRRSCKTSRARVIYHSCRDFDRLVDQVPGGQNPEDALGLKIDAGSPRPTRPWPRVRRRSRRWTPTSRAVRRIRRLLDRTVSPTLGV